jgi:transposase
MPRAIRISRARFTAMWSGHVGGDAIATAFGIDRSTVTKIAKRYDLPLRLEIKVARRVIPFDQANAFAAMWLADVKCADIARHFDCNRKTVENHAKRLGLALRGKGNATRWLTIADYHAAQLREAMAATAKAEQAAALAMWRAA